MTIRKSIFFFSPLLFVLFFGIKPQILHGQNLEVDLLKKINGDPPSSKLWRGVSITAEPLSASVPAFLLAVGLIEKNTTIKKHSFEMIGSLALATTVTEALKLAVNRQRPYQKYSNIHPDQYENGASFPSGHTSIAYSTATSLAIQYKRWYLVVPAYLWASSVAYSRLYLGQHYPSDILASIIIGSGSAFVSNKIAALIKRNRNKNTVI